MTRVHITISGHVQGVFYRAECEKHARNLGVKGWVRNTGEGGVEVMAEGEKEILDELVVWCQFGPPMARVEELDLEWLPATGEFEGFGIK